MFKAPSQAAQQHHTLQPVLLLLHGWKAESYENTLIGGNMTDALPLLLCLVTGWNMY